MVVPQEPLQIGQGQKIGHIHLVAAFNRMIESVSTSIGMSSFILSTPS